MRVSEIQRRRALPVEEQPVPARRLVAWVAIAALIAGGVVLFFRYARGLEPLLN